MIKKDLSESLSFVHGSINVAYGNLPSNFPSHWHSCLEIIAPCTDNLEITISNKVYHLNKQQFALIPPRKLHSISGAKNAPQLIIQFSNNFLPQLYDFTANRHLLYLQKIIDNDDFHEHGILPLDILFKIKDYYYSDIPFKEFHIYQSLLELFIILGKYNFTLNDQLSAKKNLQDQVYYEKFDSIAKYIDTHHASKVSLEDVASYAGFSKYHFSRIFKEYFETPFPEYVMKQRIKHAIEILENPDVSILNAAFSSGFSSQSSFNRAFKQIMHCTPSDFRKMFKCSPIE